jgi:hypothetical protein
VITGDEHVEFADEPGICMGIEIGRDTRGEPRMYTDGETARLLAAG